MWFFKKKKAPKLALEQEKQIQVEQDVALQTRKVEEVKPEEVMSKPVQENLKPEVEEKVIEKQEEAPKKAVQQKTEAPKKAAPKPKPVETIEEEDDDPKKDVPSKLQKYHVSQNKDPKSDSFKKWRVRKEGSSKTIKYFDTQKEAIDFADDLAEKAGSSVVIHKIDGSIRKQDYSKKA